MSDASQFLAHATNPFQYDGKELKWSKEGDQDHFTRRMLLEGISPFIKCVTNQRALDVGCGRGWLCNVLAEKGAMVLGIDPSFKNIQTAKQKFPNLSFEQVSLEKFKAATKFDIVTMVMVTEHFRDLKKSFTTTSDIMSETGRLIVVNGDFDWFVSPRNGYVISVENEGDGIAVTRTDYGERAGIIYDVLRTSSQIIQDAEAAGFTLVNKRPIKISDWVVKEEPSYASMLGRAVFQIYEFTQQQV